MAFFVFHNSLTPAARMSPNREANAVYNAAVKPSFVSVAECKRPNTDDRAEASTTDNSSAVGVAVTPSVDAVARDIGKQGDCAKRVVFGASLTNTWNSAHGDGACETVSGEGRDFATVVLHTERVGGRETRSAMSDSQLNIIVVRGGYGRAHRLLPF